MNERKVYDEMLSLSEVLEMSVIVTNIKIQADVEIEESGIIFKTNKEFQNLDEAFLFAYDRKEDRVLAKQEIAYCDNGTFICNLEERFIRAIDNINDFKYARLCIAIRSKSEYDSFFLTSALEKEYDDYNCYIGTLYECVQNEEKKKIMLYYAKNGLISVKYISTEDEQRNSWKKGIDNIDFEQISASSNDYVDILDKTSCDVTIKTISVINNEICIDMRNEIDNADQVSILFIDRNEKCIVCEQSISCVESTKIKVTLDEHFLGAMLENYMMKHIRMCLLKKDNKRHRLYYIKNGNKLFFSTCINRIKKFNDKKEVVLYYSAAGLLSVKVVNGNKISFNDNREYVISKKDITINSIDENSFNFTVAEQLTKYSHIHVLLVDSPSKLKALKVTNIVGNISDIKRISACQFEVKWNLGVININELSKNRKIHVVLYCYQEENSELILLTKSDFKSKDRFVYDLRSNYLKSLNFNTSYDMVPFFDDNGFMLTITRPEFVYKEQFTAILEDIAVNGNDIYICVKCIPFEGKYIGFVLYDSHSEKERFISKLNIEKDRKNIKLSASLHDIDFLEFFGNVEIYSVLELNSKKYYIPIIAGNSALIMEIHEKKNLFMNSMGAYIYALLSSKNKIYFKKKFAYNSFNEKNIQTKVSGLDFGEAIKNVNNLKPAGNIYAEIIDIKEEEIILSINSEIQENYNAVIVYLCDSDKTVYVQEAGEYTSDRRIFSISTSCFRGYTTNKNRMLFRICIFIKYRGNFYYLKLCNLNKANKINSNSFYDRRDSYFTSINSIIVGEERYNITPYYAMNGTISLCVVKEELTYDGQFANKLEEVRIHKNHLEIRATCWKLSAGKWNGFKLNYRGKRIEDSESYIIPYTEIEENDSVVQMKAVVNLKKLHLKMIYWDIKCLFEIDDKQYQVGAFCDGKVLHKYYEKALCRDYYHDRKDKSILYPYVTKTNTIALAHREYYPKYDTTLFRVKERVALNIYKKNKKQYDSKNIYLIYEKYCTAAQDNGYYFFMYCMENNVEEQINGHIYYVIDKKSNDYKNVSKYKEHVIEFASLKHMIYLLAARLYISTDTKEHSYVYRVKGSVLMPYILKKDYIFLQHGVIALKKIDHVYSKGKFGQCKKMVVSSDYEREIVEREFKYDRKDLIVTGLARWDVLEDKSAGKRKIMIVPTWRSWLDDVENDVFVNSVYFKRYMELLNDRRLYSLLEEYDVTADFYIHIKFKDYICNFDTQGNSRVRLNIFGERPLNEMLMECKLLITDYSSVSWDIYYQRKPVLFYQFDIDDYMYAHGSYIDFETELFGDRAQDINSLLVLLEDYFKADFELKPKYASIQEGYFKYIDNKNCERIWNEIKKIHNKEFVEGGKK